MNRDLNSIDPLPSFMDDTWFGNLPPAKRHQKEWSEACKQADGEDWHPTETKHLYRNGKGQFKYTPPTPQDPDIPIPFIAFHTVHVSFADFASLYPGVAEAEPQTQAASQMEMTAQQADEYRRSIYERLGVPYDPKLYADADGWIPHKPGDPIPCDPMCMVKIKCRDGDIDKALVREFGWEAMEHSDFEIIAWKPA